MYVQGEAGSLVFTHSLWVNCAGQRARRVQGEAESVETSRVGISDDVAEEEEKSGQTHLPPKVAGKTSQWQL